MYDRVNAIKYSRGQVADVSKVLRVQQTLGQKITVQQVGGEISGIQPFKRGTRKRATQMTDDAWADVAHVSRNKK
jgi:hypothetical protein